MKTIKVGDVFTYEDELYVVKKDLRKKGSNRVIAAAAHNFYGMGFWGFECEFSFEEDGAILFLKQVKI